MILVTGAAGKTGRAVLQALLARNEPARALVYRPDQIALLESTGVQEVLAGDMRDPAVMQAACEGAGKIYHICPNVSPAEVQIGRNVISAARSAGVQHIVYHSVLYPQTQGMPHHWQKQLVEEQLLASDLTFTILQPAVYMQNILAQRDPIVEQGVFPLPYPPNTRLSFVNLGDIAQVAAIVLTEPGHDYATYPLAGTSGISQAQIALILSRLTSREVRVEQISLAEWERQARDRGLGEYQVKTLLAMFRYYAQHGLVGNPQVLGWLLGRPPLNLETFLLDAFHQPDLINHRNPNL